MAGSTDKDIRAVLPEGARVTSTYRTPAHNKAVGGVENSYHTRGTPDSPQGLDLVPPAGMSMAQLRDQIAASGVPVKELIDEGDHVHVGIDGQPLGQAAGGTDPAGYRVVNNQDLAPTDTPESLRAQGYELDPNRNVWARVVGQDPGAAPLDTAYARRQEERETAALDQEEADLNSMVQAGFGVTDQMAGAVAKDVGKGIFLEGGQAVVSGVKRGLNEMEELAAMFNDATIDRVPGVQQAENLIRDNAFRVGRMVRNLFGAKDGRSVVDFRNEAAQLPTNEGERPESVTGKIIEGVTQFASGFAVAGQVLKPIQAVSKAGSVGKAMAQGAIADFSAFDGNEARLSNLLAEHSPKAIAPMFEFLAAEEDDPELLGRFKNSLEGGLLGAGTEVLASGLRTLKAARGVRRELKASAEAEGLQVPPDISAARAAADGEAMQEQVRAALGNPAGPRFGTTERATAPEVVRVSPEENYLNPELPGFRVEVPGVGQEAVIGSIRPDGQWQVALASIPETVRGQGLAVRAYVAAAKAADAAGARLVSDSEVTPAAVRVWEGLERRGWRIERNPDAALQDRGGAVDLNDMGPESWRTPDGSPMFVAAEPPKPTMATKMRRGAEATDGTTPEQATTAGANIFDINLARIETPEDVQAVITGMADRFSKDVDLARRATRTWEQTREASGRVDWVQAMAERRVGGAVNAETALAFREATNASATKVLELARAVQAEPTLANQYAFRRATAAHYAIQNELMGARAEAGRALNAFKIPAGSPANALRQVDDLLADAGGANSAQELANRILAAADKGDVALNQMIRGGALARSRDLIKFMYTNSLLSGVGTPVINAIGNGGMLALNVASRAVAPRLARAFGGDASTQIGEATAIIHGYQMAMRDIFKLKPGEAVERIGANAGESLRRDGLFRGMAPGLDDAAPAGLKMRAEREEAGMLSGGADRPLSAAAWRVEEDSVLGRTLDIMNMIVGAPSNINALTDDVFKTISARGELHAQAFRQAMREGLEGSPAAARMAELLDNPTDDMLRAAEQEMHDLTFTRQTPRIAQSFADLRKHMDNNPTPIPFGTVVLPFIRTPANLISMGMRYSPLAPFSRRFRDDLAAGGAAAETAKARVAVGTALWSVWMGMAMDGQITGQGPGNRGQKEALMRTDEFGGQVFQPYSVRFGDRWYSFERADPLGQGLSLIGDMAELMKNADWDEAGQEELTEVAAHAIQALGQAFFDKTILKGATEFTSAILDGTTADAERLLMQRASGAVPGSSFARMLRRGDDEYLRETWNVTSAIRNTLPGFSDDLPPQRDLWGKPRTYQTGLGTVYDAITPVQTRAAGGAAIDLEILNNGVSVQMPGRSISIMGETVSLKNRPDIYSEFIRLSGEPAFEQLNAVVEGRHPDSEFYFSLTDGPSGGKAEYINDVISDYRSVARAAITEMYASDLQDMAAEKIRRRDEARMPE